MRNLGGLQYLFTYWNWKSALGVGLVRGAACLLVLPGLALHARLSFGLVEFVFVLATSGFSTALQQQSLEVKNRQLGWILCVLVIPFVALGLDAGVHLWLNGAIGMQIGLMAVIVTLVSAMFHWFIMSKGAMLVGEQARPLSEDLLAMPRLTVQFVTEPALAMWKLGRGQFAPEQGLLEATGIEEAREEISENLAA